MKSDQNIIRGRYKVIREISRGGMGAVYLAKDLLKNREVALKKSFFSGHQAAHQAFETEAKLLARLDHPGLPKVLDYFFLENDFQSLVMDYVTGETLEGLLESGKYRVGRALDSAKVTDWALQILDVLRYLHNFEPPVVHRDIKPNNIKLTAAGKIVLLDFGLAKGSAVTIVGGMSGYSPIEQVNHTGTDPRSDIYALGTTLFHLLTDQHPYTALNRFREIYGQSLMTNLETHGEISRNSDPQMTVAEINSHVPEEISKIVNKSMALFANDRFQTAEEMKAALLKAKQTLAVATRRQVINNVAGQTILDNVNDWEKEQSLFDDDEESLGTWKSQTIEENSCNEISNDELLNNEKIDSFASFVPQKIGHSHSDLNSETTEIEKDILNDTVSSDVLFEKSVETKKTKPSFAVNLSPTIISPEKIPLPEIEFIGTNNPPRKINRRILPLISGAAAFIFLVSIGALAWYLIPLNSRKINSGETKNLAEIPAALPETKEIPAKPLNISTYRIDKNSEKTLLGKDYQFAEKEKFKFGLISPNDGFLYVISRDNQFNASLVYPSPAQIDNFIKKNSESFFPRDELFKFDKNTPSEAWIYFVIVPSRDDNLVKLIQKTLDAKDKSISIPEVGNLFKELDKLADDSSKSSNEAANKPIVEVRKIQKKV